MSTPFESQNLATARRYLEAIEQGDPEGHLAFFAADVVQEEFPNRLVPQGATRDLAALREAEKLIVPEFGEGASTAVATQGRRHQQVL
jgi:ketosteroid isomerase-like protein